MYFVACFAGLQSVAAQNILCNVDEGRREIINETLYTVPPNMLSYRRYYLTARVFVFIFSPT